ncbi:Uncharacterised protein [Vibrio cholerae]|nr:Uncharacterised protein [Vibrio cholerae]
MKSGLPENSSPSHHTLPASIASFSVCDRGGSTFLNILKAGSLIHFLRRELIFRSFCSLVTLLFLL